MNAERLLGMLLNGGLGGSSGGRGRRKRKSGLSGLMGNKMAGTIGLGAIGVAMAAFEHFSNKDQGGQSARQSAAPQPVMSAPPAAPGQAPSAPPPPPPGMSAGMPPPPPPPPPAASPATATDATLLIRAMVAAANADGVIDGDERAAILAHVGQAGLDADESAFVRGLLDAPPSVDDVVAAATTDELRNQVYAVSLMAIDVDTDAERHYLEQLRGRLGLTTEAVAKLHSQLGVED